MSSTLQWLGRTTLALLLVVGLPQFAHAAFIDLVSQSYRIQASGMGYGPSAGLEVQYDETSNTPLERHDHVNMGGGGLILDTFTDGGLTSESAFVQARSTAIDLGTAFAQFANADATMTFRPLVNNVIVRTLPQFGPPSTRGFASLYDETAGAALLALGIVITPATYNVSLDPTHLYTMSVSAHSCCGIDFEPD
jgi:hypothetical protein